MPNDRVAEIVDEVVDVRLRDALRDNPEWRVVPPAMFADIWQTAMLAGIAALAASIGEPHA